jgi:hypothetical protein
VVQPYDKEVAERRELKDVVNFLACSESKVCFMRGILQPQSSQKGASRRNDEDRNNSLEITLLLRCLRYKPEGSFSGVCRRLVSEIERGTSSELASDHHHLSSHHNIP